MLKIIFYVAISFLIVHLLGMDIESAGNFTFIFGIFTASYCLFLTDAISQIFSGVPNRDVFYSRSFYHSQINIFINHNIIGTVLPSIVLFSIMKWYFAIPALFILIQVIFILSKRLFDNNLKIFKIIILNPLLFRSIALILFSVFLYIKYR
ncbi:hypothetical protein OBK15_11140 [Empedobacter falsenii]